MEYGIINKPAAWLYGEDLESRTDELFMGWAVGVLQKDRGWAKIVTHYGYTGYLRADAFCPCTKEDLANRDECGRTVFVSRAFADIMAEPKVRSSSLATLARGSFLTLLPEVAEGYRNVLLADGREGYLPCVSYGMRRDRDGYLYEDGQETYFLRQRRPARRQEALFRKQLTAYAKRYLGTQYRWAGKSPEGIDCSGFTFMCYLMCGILIYRDAALKAGYPVQKIRLSQVKPGDLLYFPGHIAMYIGNYRYIHATGHTGSFGCVINSLSPKDPDFRQDLADTLSSAGTVIW